MNNVDPKVLSLLGKSFWFDLKNGISIHRDIKRGSQMHISSIYNKLNNGIHIAPIHQNAKSVRLQEYICFDKFITKQYLSKDGGEKIHIQR